MSLPTLVRAAGLLCAAAAAALWAIALTVWQPLTEPVGSAENNSYWVREVRFMAIVAVVCGLVLVFRGALIRSVLTAVGSLGWVGVDLWLDRLDVAGRGVTIRTVVIAVGVVLAAGLAGLWRSRQPNRYVLTLAAAVAAALSPVAAATTSPADTEPGLNPSALVLGGLLAVLAVGCALATVEPIARGRATLALLAAFAAVDATIVTRVGWPAGYDSHAVVSLLVHGAVLLIAVTVLTRAALPATALRWAATLAAGAGLYIAYSIASLTLFFLSFFARTGAPFTALAGSP